MASYGEPDWASPSNDQVVTQQIGISTVGGAPISNAQNVDSAQDRDQARLLIALLSIVDMLLSIAMAALGVLMLIEFNPSSVQDYSDAFVGSYMILFAGLLFTYELIWWQPIKWLNRTFRKNFGFLYGLKGKGFYMFGVAFLCLGPMDDSNDDYLPVRGLDYGVLIGWLLCSIVHLFFGCTYPAAQDVYRPPTANFDGPGDPNAAINHSLNNVS